MPLYFIALLPDERLLEEITQIKKEIRTRFGPNHALKLPPHITLQIPFNMPQDREPILEENLQNFSRNEEKFEIRLDGFGAFKPRVIYIKIQQPEALVQLHERLQEMLMHSIGLSEREQVENLHPHVTLATRDVKKEVFKEMWSEFRNREFSAAFKAEELYVFKHNGKTWDIWQKFALV